MSSEKFKLILLFEDIHYGVLLPTDVNYRKGVKKLTIKVEENAVHVSSSSSSKPLDIDLNESMSPDQDMVKGSIKFKVTNINDVHTCPKTQFNPYHRNATAKLLGKLILPKIKDVTRVYRPKDIMFDMNLEWNVYVSYKRAWKAKQLALTANYGCPIESFSELPIYCHNLKLANEDSVTHIETDAEGRFKMCFIAFGFAVSIF
ncbi:hypothetical protein Tco_1150186 [Tanacetum coccineum]